MTHWAENYIGHPWQAGAQGPDAWDCWGLFRHVQAAHFGLDVPVVDVDAMSLPAVARAFGGHAERARWVEVSTPQDGDAVLMAHNRFPSHVGVWLDIDGGGVLHCQQGSGTLFTRRAMLPLAGWSRASFWRHRSRCAA